MPLDRLANSVFQRRQVARGYVRINGDRADIDQNPLVLNASKSAADPCEHGAWMVLALAGRSRTLMA
jgi:hypothetical protein